MMRRRVAVLVFACAALWGEPAAAAGSDVIARDGFGSAANSYSWSMAWFKGKLYVGTARNQLCVENATLDFYNPGVYYKSPPESFPEVGCPPDRYDMDLRAEIWRFDPRTSRWARVYQSPADIPNPRAPGKFVARDIGFRNMIVHRGPDGREALYIAGVSTDEYIPELAERHPPRILRSTDGRSFTALRGAPGVLETPFGEQRAMGYRAMASYKGRLFVTAGGGLTGDGVIVEVKRPWSSSPSFVQVSPETIAVFELEVFDGSLYLGAGDANRGYAVWKTDMGSPARFVPVVRDGAGRGKAITSVVSMHAFEDRLYVGASGWGLVFPSSELIRVGRDGRFEVVSGNARVTPDGEWKFPISGLPDGFGNLFNGHFWRQETHDGAMYLGTNDWSWAFRHWPWLGEALAGEFGFDVYGTCDGQYWWPVTRNAFEAGRFNFGARTMVSTRVGGFIGSANHAQGTSVWRNTDASPCGPSRREDGGRPRRLLGDAQSCGTVLSWERSPGAAGYRVLRSEYRAAPEVGIERAPVSPGGGVPDVPAWPVRSGGDRVNLSVAGSARVIGTTRGRMFVDRTAKAGARYAYEVVAVSRSGAASPVSNIAMVPSARPQVTFEEASAALRRLDGDERERALRSLAAAQRSWRDGDRGAALAQLAGATAARAGARTALAWVARSPSAGPARAEATDVVRRLARRLQHAGACRR